MDIQTEIMNSMEEMQREVAESNEIRTTLINKLKPVVNSMNITPGEEKPTVTDAKLNVIKTVDDILKSKETAVVTMVKTMLAKKENSDNEKANQQITEVLKQISTKIQPKVANSTNMDEADEMLEKQFEKNGLLISDDELVMGQESESTKSEEE